MNGTNVKKVSLALMGPLLSLWGWLGWMVIIYLSTMAIDYITGSAVAIKQGVWKSSIAREGLWKKCGSIIMVMVSSITDLLLGLVINNVAVDTLPFSYEVLLTPLVIVWYTLTELGSIIENAAKMGAQVPPFLKKSILSINHSIQGEEEMQNENCDEKNK